MSTEPLNVTQVANPGRATARTVFQNILGAVIGFGLLAPFLLQWLVDALDSAGLNEQAAFVATALSGTVAVAAALARVMALPSVEDWLQGSPVFRWLAAAKADIDNGPGDMGFDASVSGYSSEDRREDSRLTDDGTPEGNPIVSPESDASFIQEDEDEKGESGEEDGEPRHRADGAGL